MNSKLTKWRPNFQVGQKYQTRINNFLKNRQIDLGTHLHLIPWFHGKSAELKLAIDFTKYFLHFLAHYDAVENEVKSSTVGLVTMEEMKNIQEKAVKDREMQLARKNQEELKQLKKEEKAKKKAKQKQIKALSFNPDEDEEDEEETEEKSERYTLLLISLST